VKSQATAGRIKEAVANLASAKRLLDSDVRYGYTAAGSHQPEMQLTSATFFAGALFLSMRGKVRTLAEAYASAVLAIEKRERCDALCVVDNISVLWGNPSQGPGVHFCFRGEQAEAPILLTAEQDALLFFYLTLAEHLANWITPPMRWMPYVFGRPENQSPIEYKYAYWYDDNDPPDWLTRREEPRETP
jgi:hypothetical protein